jgi:hypothetical protein
MELLGFAAMADILYQRPVEKQRCSRILCGFLRWCLPKRHKNRGFGRDGAVRTPYSSRF